VIPGLSFCFAGISDPVLRYEARNLILNPTTTTTDSYKSTYSDKSDILSKDLVYTVLGVGASALALVLIIILLGILVMWKR
jgi:hypothetical protein